MYTAGHTYEDDILESTSATQISYAETHQLNGSVSFNGQQPVEDVGTLSMVQSAATYPTTKKTYIARVGDSLFTYGVRSNSEGNLNSFTEITYSPPIETQLSLGYGVKWPRIYTKHQTNPDIPDIQEESDITLVTTEQVSAPPAGTFVACKIRFDTTTGTGAARVTTSNYQWIIAQGRYQGMLVKAATEPFNGDTTIATRLLIDGK